VPQVGVGIVAVVRWCGESLAVIRWRSAVGWESKDEGPAAAHEAVGGGSSVGVEGGVEIEDDGGEIRPKEFAVVIGVGDSVGCVVRVIGDPGDGGGREGAYEVERSSPRCTLRAGEGIQTARVTCG